MALTKATPGVLSKAYVEKTDDTENVLGGTIALTEKIFTISSGAVTPTRSNIVLAAQSGTSDTLDQIVTTSLSDDTVIILSVDTGDTITINDAGGAAGQIHLIDNADFVMSGNERLCLIRDGADWYELWRTSTPYTSAETAITADTVHTFAHSLGAVPSLVQVSLKCTSTDAGYAANDIVQLPLTLVDGASAENGAIVMWEATNVRVITGVAVGIIGYASFNAATIDFTKWKLIVKAWA